MLLRQSLSFDKTNKKYIALFDLWNGVVDRGAGANDDTEWDQDSILAYQGNT